MDYHNETYSEFNSEVNYANFMAIMALIFFGSYIIYHRKHCFTCSKYTTEEDNLPEYDELVEKDIIVDQSNPPPTYTDV